MRSYTNKYLEDYGLLLSDNTVYLFENGITPVSKCSPISPVIRVNAFWVKKDIKVKCSLADTPTKKRVGLQNHTNLEDRCGMYFPYVKYTDVAFHQGSVPFAIDVGQAVGDTLFLVLVHVFAEPLHDLYKGPFHRPHAVQ